MRIDLKQAAAKLKQGEVVAIPTETVYGLAGDARNERALKQIYAVKERPANNPLIVHIASIQQVNDWASAFPPLAQKLAHAFWPGPFTLVLPAKPEVSNIVRAGEPTVALRVPAHALTQQLLLESGLGLAAPSANKYTQLSPTCAEHVETGLGQDIAILDGGACQVGIESTIVAVDGDDWQLLRHGMIEEAAVEKVAGKPALSKPTHTPKAPGQHLLHYSPKTPTKTFDNRADLIAFADAHQPCAALLFGAGAIPQCEHIALANTPNEAAVDLYDALHRLDNLKHTQLLIELPPKTKAWAAISDRLTRATHQTS
jgi:L-threonylcarbamoyladenylate synthase